MAQRVKDIKSDEIIDEKKILKEAEEREKEAKKEAKVSKEKEKKARKERAKSKVEKKVSKVQVRKKPKHSKKYREAIKKVDKSKVHTLDEAIKLLNKISTSKFDETIEMHLRVDPKVENVRGTVNLPGGVVKEKRVLEVDEKNIDSVIERINKGKIDFDIIVAKSSIMAKFGKVAKVLGPKGLMPNPKSGTVVEDTKKAVEDFKSGKFEYKTDKGNNVHVAVGKVSWKKDKIIKNINVIISVMPKDKIVSAHLSTTMSPSIKIKFN